MSYWHWYWVGFALVSFIGWQLSIPAHMIVSGLYILAGWAFQPRKA